MVPQIKVVLLGDQSVGKTSLLNYWLSNTFEPDAAPTIGGVAQTKRENYDGTTYCFQIWDTAGAEKVSFFFNSKSFAALDEWVDFLHQQGDIPFIIVGNKEDLTAEITEEEATNYSYSVGGQYYSASAKTGSGVENAFRALEICAIEFYKKKPHDDTPMIDPDTVDNTTSGGCC
ncbi:small GTP-binding protein [Histomonas meleagridis]|uniref:small GTP-binding protein n=1 Tax=Histomonas meleagridis TaxID=135588 RepID=UPI00355A8281|nr:small GTP-binding protein [Histomonas meleagridis]KAH0798729.1 small GTP-binding protein [Histomonas meleagridis]